MSKTKTFRTALTGVLLCLLLCAIGSGSVLISEDELQDTSIVNYNLTYAERGDFVKLGTTGAEVHYVDNIQLRFKNNGARLKAILVKKEAFVQEGDVLASFDIERSLADLTGLKVDHQRAVEADMQAQQDHREKLDEMQTAIREESDAYEREKLRIAYQKAELEYEKYQHSYAYEQQNRTRSIEKMEEDLNDNQLIAPFDAVIRTVSTLHPGDSVTADEMILSVYSKENFLLRVDNSNNQIRYNMKVNISAGNRNDPQRYTGTVVASDNVLPEKLRTGVAYIAIDQMDEIDPDEMRFVSIEYDQIKLSDVVMIKRRALTMERGSQYLSLLVDDTVKKRFMNVGMHNNDVQWILQGLNEGDAAILN